MTNRKNIILLSLPFCLFFLLFFLSALFKSLITSFGYYPVLNMKKFTWEYYISALSDASFLSISWRTFLFSVVSAFLACIIGMMIAITLYRHKKDRGIVFRITELPVMLPHIFVVIALFQLLSQTGVVPNILIHLGLLQSTEQFPLLLNDNYQIGVIITYLYKEIPFVIVSLMLVLRQMNDKYEVVALNLGANKFQTFWNVTLPMIQTALVNAFIINFSFNFGSYEVPFLLGNQQKELLPVYIYNYYVQGDITQIPLVMSLNMILSVFSIVFAAVLLVISKKIPGGRIGGNR